MVDLFSPRSKRPLRALAWRLVLAALAAGPTFAGNLSSSLQGEYDRLATIAGEPVDSVRFFRVHYWQPLGERALVLWLGREEPYLIDLRERCPGLPRELVLRLGDYQRPGRNLLRARWSMVYTGELLGCRIGRIRALDFARLGDIDPRVLPPPDTLNVAQNDQRAATTRRRNWMDLSVLKSVPPLVSTAVDGQPPQGRARFGVEVDRDGAVVDVELLAGSGSDEFDRAAQVALRQWRFAAPRNAGSDQVWVDVSVTIPPP